MDRNTPDKEPLRKKVIGVVGTEHTLPPRIRIFVVVSSDKDTPDRVRDRCHHLDAQPGGLPDPHPPEFTAGSESRNAGAVLSRCKVVHDGQSFPVAIHGERSRFFRGMVTHRLFGKLTPCGDTDVVHGDDPVSLFEAASTACGSVTLPTVGTPAMVYCLANPIGRAARKTAGKTRRTHLL